MDDWNKPLTLLLLKHPESGIDPDTSFEYTDEELWGIYVQLRDTEPD